MKHSSIRTHEKAFPVALMCRVLRVSRSGYYAFRKRSASRQERHNCPLTTHIKAIHQESRQVYGSPRI